LYPFWFVNELNFYSVHSKQGQLNHFIFLTFFTIVAFLIQNRK